MQALVFLPWFLIVGTPDELSKALLMGAGWAINLAVAEWIIRRRPAREVERKFKDKLKCHDPIAQAQNFVDGYTRGERLPVRNSDRAYYAKVTTG